MRRNEEEVRRNEEEVRRNFMICEEVFFHMRRF